MSQKMVKREIDEYQQRFRSWAGAAMLLTLSLLDQICNFPYCQHYNSYNVSLENLVLDQLIIPKLIFFFILVTYLVDIVLIM